MNKNNADKFLTVWLLIILTSILACPPHKSDTEPVIDESKHHVSKRPLPFQITTGHCQRCEGHSPNDLRVAAIIEPREHPLLVPIVKAVIGRLPNNWIIQIFHGRKNSAFLANNAFIAPLIASGKIVLSRMETDNLTVSDYNHLLLNPSS